MESVKLCIFGKSQEAVIPDGWEVVPARDPVTGKLNRIMKEDRLWNPAILNFQVQDGGGLVENYHLVIRKTSCKVVLEMPAGAAKKLQELWDKKDSGFMKALAEFGIVDLKTRKD